MPSSLARRPTAVVLVACLAVAGLSFLLEPFALLIDPWAWVVWGRELVHLDLDTASGPSWKPLPVLLVAPLSLAGDAAPVLWELVARASALLAFVMAWRAARRLAGVPAAWIAAAALAVSLLPSWMNIVAMGREEGLLCALILWAIERHLSGREAQAFALGFGAALLRPEAWPFFGGYGLWLLWRRPRRRVLVAALLALLLPLWFLPDIVTVGDPLQSSQKAQGGISGTTLTEPVRRAYGLVPPALQLAALAAAAIAAVHLRRTGLRAALRAGAQRGANPEVTHGERELTVLTLFLAALAWVALVAVTSKVANYAGASRFQHPAAAVISVLAGVGAVWVVHAVAGGLARGRRGVPAAAALALVAATLPTLPSRARRIDEVVKGEQARSDLDRTLGDAVDAAGGRQRVLSCGSPYTSAGTESALAWHLERHIDEVSSDAPRPPGAVVRVDSKALRSEKARRLGIRLYPVRDRSFDPVAVAGVWEVLAACRSGVALGRRAA